jgi:WD40 repeat protein
MTGTGEQLFAVSGIGGNNGRPAATSDGLVLIPQSAGASAVLLDTGVRGELGSVVARDEAETVWVMLMGSLRFSHPYCAFADLCNGREVWTMRVVDVTRPRMHYSLPSGGGDAGVEISPDGTLFVRQEAAPPATGPVGAMYGPLKIWSLATGQEIRELQGLCSYQNLVDSPENVGECRAFPETPFPIWASRLRWSPDGSLIAAVPHPSPGWGGFVAVWNARDGTLLPTKRLDDGLFVEDAIFTPDSKHLIVSIRELNASGVMVEKWSTDDWHVAGERITLEAGRFLSFVGFAPDGSTLYAISGFRIGGAALHWIDAATLEELRPRRDRIHDANALAMAQSADGSLLATGATDGFVRVWSAATGALEHEISFGTTEVEGVAFITETRLAVVLADGNLRLVTIDKDELLDLVRDSLTRGYTESECERFNFGDQCPSLAELREG